MTCTCGHPDWQHLELAGRCLDRPASGPRCRCEAFDARQRRGGTDTQAGER